MNKRSRNISIITMLLLAVVSLCACGGLSNPGSRDEGAVSGAAVSGAAVSGSAHDEKSDGVTLQISIGGENPVTIPDPAETDGEVFISLQEEMYDEDWWNDEISDQKYEERWQEFRKRLFTDLSFAGFENEVVVTSFAIGYVAEQDSSVAKLHFQQRIEEEKAGNCLALYVMDGMSKDIKYNDDETDYTERMESDKNYVVIIDYANKTCYKSRTEFLLDGLGAGEWNELTLTDLTGDGLDELMIQHCYNRTVMLEIYRYEKEKEQWKKVYTNWKGKYKELFSGYLEDDYKVVMEFKDIGFSETVSMLDAGYEAGDLEIGGHTDEDTYELVRLWDDKKLRKEMADQHESTVSLYTVDQVSVEKNSEGFPQLVLKRSVEVVHRMFIIGDMYIYFQYDEESDSFVLTDARFEPQESNP